MSELMVWLLPVASWLLFASLKSVVVIPLVLLVRWLFARWLTPQARYGLWFAVIACLAIPFGAQVEIRGATSAIAAPAQVHAAAPINAGSHAQPEISISAAPVARSFDIPLETMAMMAWLLGVAVLAAVVLRNSTRYARMGTAGTEPDAATTQVFEDCRQLVKIRRQVRLVETPEVESPVLVGYWRPTLLLPLNLSSQISREQLRLVLLHELTHVARHDILANWLITLVQVAHWFNPLAWYALRIARHDMEQACDAGVLRHLSGDEQFEYGNTLIRLSDITPRRALLVQNASVVESRSQLKERINMIAKFKPLGTASSMLGATLIALISIVACTQQVDAPQAATSVEASATAPRANAAEVAIPVTATPAEKLAQEPAREARPTAPKRTAVVASQPEAGDATAPRVDYLQVNYAKAADLAALMKSPPGVDLLSANGTIAIDERTNILMIKDLPKNLAALRQLVAQLDVPLEQALVEGTFALVDDDLMREMAPSESWDGKSLQVTDLGTDRSAIAALEAGRSAGRVEFISRPSVTVGNRLQTSIRQSVDLPRVESSGAATLQFTKAELDIRLSPIMRPDGRIAMNFDVHYDRVGSVVIVSGGQRVPSIDTTQVTSQLLMESGASALLHFPRANSTAGTSGQANPERKRQLVAFITVRKLPSTVASR